MDVEPGTRRAAFAVRVDLRAGRAAFAVRRDLGIGRAAQRVRPLDPFASRRSAHPVEAGLLAGSAMALLRRRRADFAGAGNVRPRPARRADLGREDRRGADATERRVVAGRRAVEAARPARIEAEAAQPPIARRAVLFVAPRPAMAARVRRHAARATAIADAFAALIGPFVNNDDLFLVEFEIAEVEIRAPAEGTRLAANAPDDEIAHVAARAGIVEMLVVIGEHGRHRGQVARAHVGGAIALQAGQVERAACRQALSELGIVGVAQNFAGRPQEAAAGAAVETAALVVIIADLDAAIAVAQRTRKADRVFLRFGPPLRRVGRA